MCKERMLQLRHPLELRDQRILASRPNRTHTAGRECAADGCDTRLSIYNGFRFCWQHERGTYPLAGGRKMRNAA